MVPQVPRSLDKVFSLPTGSGLLELGAEWTPSSGLRGYGEAMWKPRDNLGAFVRGEVDRTGPRALAGVRLLF